MLLWSFFFSFSSNALRAQCYLCPLPLFSLHTIFPVTVWALYNVACGHDDWWNSQVWITGFGLQAMGGKLYKGTMSEALQCTKTFLLKWVSSWGLCLLTWHCKSISFHIWWAYLFKITAFLRVVFFQRLLFGDVMMIWSRCPCNTFCRFSHWGMTYVDGITSEVKLKAAVLHNSPILSGQATAA